MPTGFYDYGGDGKKNIVFKFSDAFIPFIKQCLKVDEKASEEEEEGRYSHPFNYLRKMKKTDGS